MSLRQALARDDWKLLASHVAGVMLMHNDTPSSYIYKLEPKILVIGRSTPYVTRLFTGVTEGKQPNPLAYSPSYLAQFPVIYLYDLPYLDAGVLEHFIRQRLSNGSTVIVDLSATQISELFGVLREDVPMEGDARLRQFTGYRTNDVALSLKSGPGASYDGLDTIYASVLVENAHYAIMGEKRLSEGTVLFTGLHLPRLIVEHDTDDLRDFMISTLPASSLLSAVSGTPRFPEAFKADTIEWSNQGLSFTYSSERDTLVGISVTYSPRWSLSIDGDQTQALNYENLISILLPKGSHKVDMKYVARTGATLAGWAVTAAGLGMYLLTYQWRRRSLSFGTPKPVSRDGVTLAR